MAEAAPPIDQAAAAGGARAAEVGLAAFDSLSPWVRRWLRAEGLVAFVGGFVLWVLLHQSPPLYFLVLLVPDVSMVGYLRGPAIGALTYNLAHNWAVAGGVLLLGLVAQSGPVILVGSVLLGHVGVDRALGYGLKYPTSFQDTHLGRIGRRR